MPIHACAEEEAAGLVLAATWVCDGDIYAPIESALSRETWSKTSDSPGKKDGR